MAPSTNHIARLQHKPECMRNICILAHVDHGKTTLSDSLLANNGIISQNLQGKIRYLDSRPDEQQRGITMEASAIALYFRVAKPNSTNSESNNQPQINEYLINLIDSPGHIDFSSEVSTASRLCDGALVLVDAVEGVCSQTVTVLRQTWTEHIKPILVLNKIDRLVTDLKLTPYEAYIHLAKLIEQVNAVIGAFYAGDRMEEDMRWRELVETHQNTSSTQNLEFVEKSDEDIYFAPEKNNVVFASAMDGWGFNISQFAAMYERKVGIKREKLEKVLWGDFFLDMKTKRVTTKAPKKTSKPLFVQLVLDTIWQVYDTTKLNRNNEKTTKIIEAMSLRISQADVVSRDPEALLQLVFHQWIPLSRAILLSVIDIVPTPVQAQNEKVEQILQNTPLPELVAPDVKQGMTQCDQEGPLVVYISKVMVVKKSELPTGRASAQASAQEKLAELRRKSQRAREAGTNADDEYGGSYNSSTTQGSGDEADKDAEVVIGIGRVFSGTMKPNQKVRLLGPKFNAHRPDEFCDEVNIGGLYMLMGRDLVWLDSVGAGSIVGISGLDGKILKSGTLVDVNNSTGPNLASTNVVAPPILRVAVEPEDPTKLQDLEQGLRLLNMSDPCVEVSVLESGEHILATAGELHLERCIRDLKERFARTEIQYSAPVVPFRETVTSAPAVNCSKDKSDLGLVSTQVGDVKLTIRAAALPPAVAEYLVRHEEIIKSALGTKIRIGDLSTVEKEQVAEEDDSELSAGQNHKKKDQKRLQKELDELLGKHNAGFKASEIVCFGSRRCMSNILVDKTQSQSLGVSLFGRDALSSNVKSAYADNVQTGFQLAMAEGLLCKEPLTGCVVEVTSIEQTSDNNEGEEEIVVPSKGDRRFISATRELVHEGLSDWSPRILLAQYLCDIQATTEVLGKVYAVVTKRRGRILTEEMREGTPFFIIHASIPVIEAFGFSEEMRKRTSGAANPQLVFSGFQVYDQDPFWVPTTEEELEDLGELADKENVALSYVTKVRRRKGLATHQKVVENAERQRNLKR